MKLRKVDATTTAEAYLELIADRGIQYFFANAGTDFAPLIEAFAKLSADKKPGVTPILVPHENAAVAMAHGNYLVTGKPQVVMVHVNVGTGNAVNGIINAARDHVPILFTAGRTPLTEEGLPGARDLYIHWTQEAFDQATMVREYVKWDYELRNITHLGTVIDRALEIAMTPPPGPVYLTLPREVLSEPQDGFVISSPPRRHLGGRIHPDPDTIETASRILGVAKNPLIITSDAGRENETVGHLSRLAEAFAIPVVEFARRHMCLPSDHPMHVGFNPKPFFDSADVILVVDSPVPWYPGVKKPNDRCTVIHMNVDPLYRDQVMRGFPCDLAIRSDPVVGIPLLTKALGHEPSLTREKIQGRFERIRRFHKEQRARWRKAMEQVSGDSPLDPLWVSHCINEVKDDETIVVNEYDLALSEVVFSKPGTYFGTPAAGGLGWGLGASVGAKLGAPDRLVIAVLGDGSYVFGNPTPCHLVSQRLGLGTLTVIFNNQVWNALKSATRRLYPEGWAARTGNFPLTELEPSPSYETLVTAHGGYGERVEHAAEVEPALRRAIRAVRNEGRQAVLNMICKKP